jgi:hypothetical protein
MAEPVLQIQAAGVWDVVWDEEYEALPMGTPNRAPLPVIQIPFLLRSHVIAIRALSQSAKPHWRYAGTLSHSFQLGTGGFGSALPVAYKEDEWLRLGETRFFHFPAYTELYFLEVKPVYWLSHLDLKVWAYTGPVSDTTEDLVRGVSTTVDEVRERVFNPPFDRGTFPEGQGFDGGEF